MNSVKTIIKLRITFPIVGEGDKEPNDTFVEQLVANAKAAIDAVDELGYIDRSRVAVGGHSYGAFMTANLLIPGNRLYMFYGNRINGWRNG